MKIVKFVWFLLLLDVWMWYEDCFIGMNVIDMKSYICLFMLIFFMSFVPHFKIYGRYVIFPSYIIEVFWLCDSLYLLSMIWTFLLGYCVNCQPFSHCAIHVCQKTILTKIMPPFSLIELNQFNNRITLEYFFSLRCKNLMSF